jgi:hypothetical protein
MKSSNSKESKSRQNVSPPSQGRKRKQEQALHQGPPTIPDTVESLSEPTNIPDEQEITWIVTKRLMSDDVEDVAEAMDALEKLVNSTPNKNADENRKTAVVHSMRRNISSASQLCRHSE